MSASRSTLPAAVPVVVVGAGPAGLAAGAALRMAGIDALLIDEASAVGAAWRGRYDRLRVNTSRHLSRLPGYPFSRSDDRWPSRDQVVEYLERFAQHHGLEPALGVEVLRVDREDGPWSVRTSRGDVAAEFVIVATGHARESVVPAWPGRDSFPGQIAHSAATGTRRRSGGRTCWWSAPAIRPPTSPWTWPKGARARCGCPSVPPPT
jgi:putative flavoprotein involved in K+ transport